MEGDEAQKCTHMDRVWLGEFGTHFRLKKSCPFIETQLSLVFRGASVGRRCSIISCYQVRLLMLSSFLQKSWKRGLGVWKAKL